MQLAPEEDLPGSPWPDGQPGPAGTGSADRPSSAAREPASGGTADHPPTAAGSPGGWGQPGGSGVPGQLGGSGVPGQLGESGVPGQLGESGVPGQLGESGVPGQPGESGVPAGTGDARVDDAVSRLAELAELPVDEHPAVFEYVHERLSEVLGDLDSHADGEARGPGKPGR